MKQSNFILTFLLTFVMLNFVYASFPVTPKQDENRVLTEEVNVLQEEEKSFFNQLKDMAPDIEWGAFALGALFGLLGVIAVFVFGGDTRSAWRGFFAWILFLVALGLFV